MNGMRRHASALIQGALVLALIALLVLLVSNLLANMKMRGIQTGLSWGAEGASLSPEYLALLIGLSLYTSAFIAEVFRAGIEAVPRGQTLAAQSLGLQALPTLRHVVLPQALKVAVPPLTSQYLNLTKNSSLAVAIGYPDLVSIANTTLNQTGRAVECIGLIMLIYLGLSLLTAWGMNRYNQRVTHHAH